MDNKKNKSAKKKASKQWFDKRQPSGTHQLITEHKPNSTISEAYRILQSNLNFKNIDQQLKVIALTSSIPGEGKSTNSANLAYTLAQSGNKVILVDADLRRPTIHRIFTMNLRDGLTTSLVEGVDPLELCKDVKNISLRILTGGPIPPNSSELLASRRMKAILERLSGDADYVIVDCPPVLGFNDTLAIANNVDGFILVVGSSVVPKPALMKAKEQLERIGGNIIGVIVNGADARDTGGYGYNYYHKNRRSK